MNEQEVHGRTSEPKQDSGAATRAIRSPRFQADRSRFAAYARSRDPRLRNELVLENERLVHYLAARFRPAGSVSAEDLIQVGYLGLIAAVERYDPDSGTSFITFAVPTIVGMIKHCLRDQSWGVKVPRRVRELSTRLRRLRNVVEQRLGRPPTIAEMARAASVAEEEVLEAMGADAAYFTHSLDAPGDTDTGNDRYLDWIGGEEPAFALLAEEDAVRSMLAKLETRHRQVIESRFFRELSQTEVAAELGISQMHVSRLERKALQFLREAAAAPGTETRQTSSAGSPEAATGERRPPLEPPDHR